MNQDLFIKKETMLELMFQMGYSHQSVGKADLAVSSYLKYLEDFNLQANYDTAEKFISLASELRDKSIYYETCLKRSVFLFIRYLQDESITYSSDKKMFRPTGVIGDWISGFIQHTRESRFLAEETIRNYRCSLTEFYNYLKKTGIDICSKSVIDFFIYEHQHHKSQFRLYSYKIVLKYFFNYLKEQGFVTENYVCCIPDIKYQRTRNLPSTYTNDEITKIISSVDRNSSVGKRNYAMVLMAVVLGLRASDITGITFDCINWKNNTITIVQSKTQQVLRLPLLPEIGNAIIDWLRSGRRKSDLPYVFITVKGPIAKIGSCSLNNAVNSLIISAGIDIKGRHHGPHAMRHSLANRMLKNEVPLPVISESLGHSSTEVTTVYLSIDMQALKKCSLPIPIVKSRLYSGG